MLKIVSPVNKAQTMAQSFLLDQLTDRLTIRPSDHLRHQKIFSLAEIRDFEIRNFCGGSGGAALAETEAAVEADSVTKTVVAKEMLRLV